TALLLAGKEQMYDGAASLGPARVLSREAGTVEVEVDLPDEGIGDHMAGVLRVVAGGTIDIATPPRGLSDRPVRPPPRGACGPPRAPSRRSRRSARRAARAGPRGRSCGRRRSI